MDNYDAWLLAMETEGGSLRDEFACYHPNCKNESCWEGWVRGETINRRAYTCDVHRELLIGFQNENSLKGAL